MSNLVVVIDASVGVSWFTNESKSDSARMLLTAAEDDLIQFFVPPLFFLELSNTLLRKKCFSAEKVNTIFGQILTLPLRVDIDSTEKILHRNLVAAQWKLTSYDAEYLTTAIEEKTLLVTEDKELLMIKEHCITIEEMLQRVNQDTRNKY